MNKLTKYYREIIIAFLLFMSLWLGFNQNVKTFGHTEVLCHSDTTIIYRSIDNIIRKEKVSYRYIKSNDTIIMKDIVYNQVTDTLYDIIELPLNVYEDSTVYVKTLGWLDSLVVFPRYKTITKTEYKKERFNMFLQAGISNDFIAPSVNIGLDKVQLGVGYNLVNKSLLFNFGYRIK